MATRDRTRIVLAVAVVVGSGWQVWAQGPIIERPFVLQPLPSSRIEIKPFDDTLGAFRGMRREGVAARVTGTVLNQDGLPAGAVGRVLLRNLTTGRAGSPVRLTAQGQFDFPGVEPGLYIAEVVDNSESVLTSSSPFTIAAAETATIWPIVPARPVSSFKQWAGNTASTVLNAAARIGVLPETPPRPVTPRR